MNKLDAFNLSMESVIVQSPGYIISDMDGETVMMSIENGKYYNLGEIGGYIWKTIDIPISINQLIFNLMNQFEVEEEQCKKDVISFLEQLISEKLITIDHSVKNN